MTLPENSKHRSQRAEHGDHHETAVLLDPGRGSELHHESTDDSSRQNLREKNLLPGSKVQRSAHVPS